MCFLRRSVVLSIVIFCCFSQTAWAIVYYWRSAPVDNVWINGNNWSTTSFFGAPAGSYPGPADVATFGLLAETTAPITFTGIPLAGVGAINAATLQRVITIPFGETLTIAGIGSNAGGNANITIMPGATMRILPGATVQGAGGGSRWNIAGTLDIVDNGAVISSGMEFYPGSTLLYSGSITHTTAFEFIDGNTNVAYAGGFPGNVTVNNLGGVTLTANTTINAPFTILSSSFNTANFILTLANGSNSINVAATLIVNNGGTLNTGTNTISGLGNFTLQAGGTLQSSNTNGFNGGAIQNIGIRTYSPAANYIFTPVPPLGNTNNLNIATAQINDLTLLSGGTTRFNTNLQINGTFTGNSRCDICGAVNLTLASGTNTLNNQLWLGNGTLTVNGTLNVGAAGILDLLGPGGGCGGSGNINGSGTINYTPGAQLNAGANWVGIFDLPELPPIMNGNINSGGAGVNVTMGASSQVNGNLNLTGGGTFNTGIFTLTVNGATNTNSGTLNIQNAGRVVIPNAITFTNNGTMNVNAGGTLEKQGNANFAGPAAPTYLTPTSVLLYSGTVGTGTGFEFPNAMPGSVTVSNSGGVFQGVGTTKTIAGTFTLQGTGTYSLNGVGNTIVFNGLLVNNAGCYFQVANDNMTINGPVTNPLVFNAANTLANFIVNPSAGNVPLGSALNISNQLQVNNGTLFTGPNTLTLTAGAGHSIAGAKTLQIDPNGRVVVASGQTLTNSGVLNVATGAPGGILEIQGTGAIAGTTPNYGTASTLLFTGTNPKTASVELPTHPTMMNGDVVVNKPGANVTVAHNIGLSGNLTINNTGNLVMQPATDIHLAGAGAISMPSSGRIDPNGGGIRVFIERANVDGNWFVGNQVNHFRINNPATVQLIGGNLTVTTTLDIDLAGNFDLNGRTLTLGNGTTVSMNSTGRIAANTLGTSTIVAQTTTFDGNWLVGPSNISNLTLNNAGGISLLNSITAYQTFFMQAGAVTLSTGALTFNGPVNFNGQQFIGNATGSLNIAGAGAITGSLSFMTTQQIGTLFLNRVGAALTLASPLAAQGNPGLTLLNGTITTTPVNLLTVANTAVGAVSGGSPTSYVNGPLARTMTGGGTYLFPIGKGITDLRFSMAGYAGTGTVQVEGFLGNAGGSAGIGTSVVNTTEYWRTDVLSGTWTGGQVQLRPTIVPLSSSIATVSATQTGAYASVGGALAAPDVSSTSLGAPPTPTAFFAVGNSTPTSPPSALVFSGITSSQFDASFTAAVPAPAGYLAVRRLSSNPATSPTNGTTYSTGNTISFGTVVAVGVGTVIPSQTGLAPNTSYSLDVYAYNGFGAGITYLTTQLLSNAVTTLPAGAVCTTGTITLPVTRTVLERNMQFTTLSINGAAVTSGGGTNNVYVNGGQPFQITYNYTATPAGAYCPGCVTQIYMGMNNGTAPNGFTYCFAANVPQSSSGSGTTPPITAPLTPGIYYVTLNGTWDYSCYSAVNFSTNAVDAIATIIVGAPCQSNMSDVQSIVPPYPTNIPYQLHTNATVTTANPTVWQIRVRDGGGSADADFLPTVVSALQIAITDPNSALQTIALYDASGTTKLGEAPASATVNFTGLDSFGPLATAPDGGQVDFLVKVTFKTAVVDQSQFSLSVTNVTPFVNRSGFAVTTAGPSSTVGNDNRIAVTATQFFLATQPVNTVVGATLTPSPVIKAVDGNYNVQTSFISPISAALTGKLIGSPVSTTTTLGVATFTTLRFSTGGTAQVLTASGALLSIVSVPFNIGSPQITASASTLPFGLVALGGFKDLGYTVSAANAAGPMVIKPIQGFVPNLKFSLQAAPAFMAQDSLILNPVGVTIAPTTVYVRFTPTAQTTAAGIILHSLPYTTAAIPWTATGIDPNPIYLAFSALKPSDASGVSSRAVKTDTTLMTIRLGTFRTDSVRVPPLVSTVVQFSVLPDAASPLARFCFLPTAGSSATSATLTRTYLTPSSLDSLVNIRIKWQNAPFSDDSTFALLKADVISGTMMTSTSLTIRVSVGNLKPKISTFTPTYMGKYGQGLSTPVIIRGTGFDGVDSVKFGGVPAQSYTVDSPTQITAYVGNGASGAVYVRNPAYKDSLAGFEFAPSPAITDFAGLDPTNGLQPYVDYPKYQASGRLVLVKGQNFAPKVNILANNPIQVRFGGTVASTAKGDNDSTISAGVGAGSTGDVEVQTVGGIATTGTNATQRFNFVKPPVLEGFSPYFGTKGTEVLVTGANFTAVRSIQFGGVTAANYQIMGDTQIRAIVGRGTSGTVSLTTIGGSTQASLKFIYVEPPAIDSVGPTLIATDTRLVITGKNLTFVSKVFIAGATVNVVQVLSPTQIAVIVPRGATSGVVSLTTPGGTVTDTTALTFVNPPIVTSFSPPIGTGGMFVTVTGANFIGPIAVKFGTIPADSVMVISSTAIIVRVPENAVSGYLIVSNISSLTLSPMPFQYVPKPSILSFIPVTGTTGETITILGDSFFNVDSVTFGGVKAVGFTIDSASIGTKIYAVVGPSGASGPVAVHTAQGTAATGVRFIFLRQDKLPPPVITTFNPQAGGPGTVVTINGVNFNYLQSVSFGGTLGMVVNVDSTATRITAVVAEGSTGAVQVVTKSGTATSTQIFGYIPPAEIPRILSPLEQDSSIITRFYRLNGGVAWTNSTNWLSRTTSVAEWKGVTVEVVAGTKRITALRLPKTNVTGVLPSFLSGLTLLRVMDLSGNRLEGALNSSIATMTNLQELRLTNNNLSGSLSALLPDSAKNTVRFTNLQVLRLDSNQFSGTIPTNICTIVSLRELVFRRNAFTGEIPACIVGLLGLTVLDLSNNKLTGAIPSEIGALLNLQELILSNNQLTGSLPASIGAGVSVAVRAKNADGGGSGEIAGLKSLTKLDASYNKLSGALPNELWNLSGLKELTLSGNRFTSEIPSRIVFLQSLEVLAMQNAGLTGTLPELATLRNLRVVQLDSNALAGAVAPHMGELRLKELGLSWNKFTSIPNLDSMKNSLEVLRLEGNVFTFSSIVPQARFLKQKRFTYVPQASVMVGSDTLATIDQKFSFSFRLDSGFANNRNQWFKLRQLGDTVAVQPLARISTELGFTTFSQSDTGSYFCKITNTEAPQLVLFTTPIRLFSRLPDAPRAVTLVSPKRDSINLSTSATLLRWVALSEAKQYEVQVSANATFIPLTFTETLEAATTSRTIGNLANLTTYYWRVRAINQGGTGAWSESFPFTTVAPPGVVWRVTTLDVGRVVAGDTARRTVTLTNLFTEPLTLKAIDIDPSQETSNFRRVTVLSNTSDDVVQPGKTFPLQVEFIPKGAVGNRQANITLTYTTPSSSILQTYRETAALRGRVVALRADTVNFKTVLVGRTSFTTLVIVNNSSSSKAQLLKDPQMPVNPDGTFSIGRVENQTLNPNDTMRISVRCVASKEGTLRGVARFVFDVDTVDVPLVASARKPTSEDVFMKVGLRVVQDNVEPGQPVTVQLYIAKPETSNPELFTTIFRNIPQPIVEGFIRVSKQVLVLGSGERRVYQATSPQPNSLLRLGIPSTTRWNGKDTVMLEFQCLSVAGDTDKSFLEIEEFKWSGGQGENRVFIDVTTGTFTSGACRADGTRLIKTTNGNSIKPPVPNPVKDESLITYTVREQGVVELSLYDASGTKVQTLVRRDHAPGEYQITINTRTIPSGAYMLTLTTPSAVLTERIDVVK